MNEAMLWTHRDTCPCCGSPLELAIDITEGNQEYVEDCEVCCAPIVIQVMLDIEGQVSEVTLRREGD